MSIDADPADTAGLSPESIQILHVEDDPEFAALVKTFLERHRERFTVHTETDPRTGLDAVRAGPTDYDCVVSDYEMPGLDGLQLPERVRAENPDLPFVLFTGRGSEEIASEAITAGVTDYLQKGGGTDQYLVLANRILNAVERYRAQRYVNRGLKAIETAQDGICIFDLYRVVRHNLRNRMNVVMGYADHLRTAIEEESLEAQAELIVEVAEDVGELSESIHRIEQIVENEGTVREPTNVSDLAESLAANVREVDEEIEIRTDIERGVWVNADEGIRYALEQAIENAIEHNDGDRPLVSISVSTDVDRFGGVIRVADDGPTISIEARWRSKRSIPTWKRRTRTTAAESGSG